MNRFTNIKDSPLDVEIDAIRGRTTSTGSAEIVKVKEHIIEIVSDSGEGAQTCGQIFSNVCARMQNGLWTVEIIPAEIEPPARSPAGAQRKPNSNWLRGGDQRR